MSIGGYPEQPSASTPPSIRNLIAQGESQGLEFKSSVRYDYQTRKVNRELTKVIAKTIAGFLNTEGGTLLIGVSDSGSILGIANDLATLSKSNTDAFERTLRNALATYLGVEIGPNILVEFIEFDNSTVSKVSCPRYHSPVFFHDGDRQEFYVRDGNQTRPLDVRACHQYIRAHWPTEEPVTTESLREIVSQVFREHFLQGLPHEVRTIVEDEFRDRRQPEFQPTTGRETPPLWIKVGTRRVLDLFLSPLARSAGWKRLFLISPWISDIGHPASLTSDQLLKRLRDDGTTAYVVTRPPEDEWHERALKRIGETGRANVVLVPGLHTKLYTAVTDYGSFAMLGSANFTQQALINREIGLLVTSYSDGRRLVSQLNYEAAQIYRLPERSQIYRASFKMT
jgi:hypothetical protein